MQKPRMFELSLTGPKDRSHDSVMELIQKAHVKVDKAYRELGGSTLVLHQVRVGTPQSIGIDVEHCSATRERVGFILTFIPMNQDDDPAIEQKLYGSL